jgi:hypothetical protein
MMHTARALQLAAALGLAAILPATAQAQGFTAAVEGGFKGYSFEDGLGPTAAQLLIVPVAVRIPFTETFQTDVMGAWAQGQVEREGTTFQLQGPVDTQVKLSWTARPWMVLSLAANLPTGNESHTAEEAVVAAVLATDLLGFRESTWGTGMAFTTGIATARRMGQWGIGLGASYRMANEFEPSAEQGITYQPGQEVRVRLGLDRNIGEAGKLSLGGTFQNFAEDQLDGRNLFQAGNRIMVDGAYAFRVGSQTWTMYGSNLWREQGDLFLSVVDQQGNVVGDSTIATGTQNLISGGLVGAIPIGSLYRLRPMVDFDLQTREENDGTDEGSGWMLAVGADFPLRILGTYDLFPRARFSTGRIKGPDLESRKVTGGEVGLTIRWGG